MSDAAKSKRVVYAALAGNLLVAVTKFVAAAITGSSAMLSEAVHTLVDSGNQGLMLFGQHRSARPPDEEHQFGHGLELYFWAFVVAILIFGLGAGVSLYEGVHKLRHPSTVESFTINYVVLGLSVLFEGASWTVALREFNRRRFRTGLLSAVVRSKDPTVFTVLFEDSAALLGLASAAIGLLLAQIWHLAWADGAASIVIGLILTATAAILASETRSLLIGEGASGAVRNELREIITNTPGIVGISDFRTFHFGPADLLVNVVVELGADMTVAESSEIVAALEDRIRAEVPIVRRVYVELATP